ncbi:MAG: flippase [Alphaproteobacteria bacterium]|nr:flippase [Alphaproteobacteria bacterium]
MADTPSVDAEQGAGAHAAQVAAGSGVVFVGNLFNRAVRLFTNWFLAGALGTAGYGLYELARTVVTILASFAPLGTDKGLVLFVARHRSAGEQEQLKGVLLAAFATGAVAGPLLAGITAVVVSMTSIVSDESLRAALLWATPAVAVWSVLQVAVGALRGAKDMRGQSLAYLLILPGGMLAGSMLPVWLSFGLNEVLIGFVLANVASLVVALAMVWRHFGALLTDRAVTARYALGRLYAFSLPEGLSSMLFRVNQWTDTLMVGMLATADDVGLYRVAVSLAMIGELPSVAVNTMFQPVVAELIYGQDEARLREVVRIVTRWMVILAAPVYLGLFLGQDLVLALYGEDYAQSAGALSILVWGQAVYVLCVPVTALIPMSGRARLNLINATTAALLNVGLNALMIPRLGFVGAAMATGVTLALWSLWRVAQVWWLMRCQAFSPRALGLIALTAALAFGGRAMTVDAGLLTQALASVAAIGVFGLAAWSFGREPGDEVLLGRVKARLGKRFGRG